MLLLTSFIFACLAPTLGFCSLNTNFFTNRQIIISLVISAALGLSCGLGANWILDSWPASHIILQFLAALCFVVLNERFFSESFGSRKTGFTVAISFLALSSLFIWLGWFWLVPAMLGIYAISSFYDLLKNWKRPKTPLFAELPGVTRDKPEIKFKHKPNVYLLLWESMHSSEALQKIYNIDTREAEDLLESHGLKIYPHTFSNKHSTPLSLKTLLSMSLDYNSPPEVLKIFKYNGYDCYFFDTMYYLSQPYMRYIKNNSAKMSTFALQLYSFAGPLFAQSIFTRFLTGNTDPFDTTPVTHPFTSMREDFQNYLSTRDSAKPGFHVLHFGAQHFGDLWFRLKDPAAQYLDWYRRGIDQMQCILQDIREKDPNAVIVAAGDHGAYHWTGITAGKASPEKNAAARGISSDRLALDFFGVILGIKWGDLAMPNISTLSHVNIFRWITASLAGKIKPDEEFDNISIYEGNFIAVRDGKPLNQFEKLTNKAFSDYYKSVIHQPELLDVIFSVENELDKKSVNEALIAADKLYSIAKASDSYQLLHFNAAQALIKSGKVEEGIEILDTLWRRAGIEVGYEPYISLIKYFMAIKNYDRALEIIDEVINNKKDWPLRETLMLKMQIMINLNKHETNMALIDKMLNTPRYLTYEPIDRFPLEIYLSVITIEKTKGKEAAYLWLKEQIEKYSEDDFKFYVIKMHTILLLLQYGEQSRCLEELQPLLLKDNIPNGFLLLYLRLCVLSGDLARAKSFKNCIDCYPKLQKNPLVYIYLEEILDNGSKDKLIALTMKKNLSTMIQNSQNFYEEWYQKEYNPATPAAIDFLKNGIAMLRNPSPKFDTRFYLGVNAYNFFSGINPIVFQEENHISLPASLEDDIFLRRQIRLYREAA